MQKWSVIMAIPLGVYLITAMVHFVLILYRLLFKRQPRKTACADAGSMAMSSILSIFYLMYIYLAKNVFDVMTCVPADPPDGLTYMTAGSAAMEPCGKPGGTQMSLLPYAIAALLVYVLGYPVGLAIFYFYRSEQIMLDQLLRAKGVGDDLLTNPYALQVRRTCSRAYYAFKPDYFWWALVVILRKLLITCTFVMFAQFPAFQLAASLLIVFLSYAAQVKFSPYMALSQFDEVIRDHMLLSLVPGSVHARLEQIVKDVESRGKKVGRKNVMSAGGRTAQVNTLLQWLFNNNTVESILLFSAIMVNLMAVMYAAVEKSAIADQALPKITGVLIAVLIVSLTYYALVFLGELYLQCSIRRERKAIDNGKIKGITAGEAKKQPMTAADVKKAAYDAARGNRRLSTKLAFNPMFASPEEGEPTDAAGNVRSQIFSRADPPDMGLWMAFKQQYGEMVNESGTLTKELNTTRSQLNRLFDAMGARNFEQALANVSKGEDLRASSRAPVTQRTRTAYKPLISAEGGTRSTQVADEHDTNPAATKAYSAYFSKVSAGLSPGRSQRTEVDAQSDAVPSVNPLQVAQTPRSSRASMMLSPPTQAVTPRSTRASLLPASPAASPSNRPTRRPSVRA
jgi:hypothetical protein